MRACVQASRDQRHQIPPELELQTLWTLPCGSWELFPVRWVLEDPCWVLTGLVGLGYAREGWGRKIPNTSIPIQSYLRVPSVPAPSPRESRSCFSGFPSPFLPFENTSLGSDTKNLNVGIAKSDNGSSLQYSNIVDIVWCEWITQEFNGCDGEVDIRQSIEISSLLFNNLDRLWTKEHRYFGVDYVFPFFLGADSTDFCIAI